MRNLASLAIFLAGINLLAQDTLTIMTYNLLKFPDATPERVDSMRITFQYTLPDILIVNELESAAGADLILNNALNQYGITYYNRATFYDGPDTDNMLFYNSNILGLAEQTQLTTTLRDISEYKLYYKAPGLNASSDTIYLDVFSVHLKAGVSDFSERADQCQTLKYYLNTFSMPENVIVGGDFNFYSGHESGSLIMRETGIPMQDPADAIGNWSGDPAYSLYHSQSSRISSFGGGVGGGLDDRFDLFYVTGDVLDNSNGIKYLEGSYRILGQDGMRFNGSVISPSPTSVPDSVANALHYSSDHLPVLMELVTDYTASREKMVHPQPLSVFYHEGKLWMSEEVTGTFDLYTISGKKLMSNELFESRSIDLGESKEQYLIYHIMSEAGTTRGKVLLF